MNFAIELLLTKSYNWHEVAAFGVLEKFIYAAVENKIQLI